MDKREEKKYSKRPAAFVGMPGCGKSTVGRLIAEQIGYPFYDADQMIESKEGMPVSQIFAEKGEPYFREIEKTVILDLVQNATEPYILSTGGGAVMTPEIHEALYERTIMIYISANLETLWGRLKDSPTKRPLLEGNEEEARQKIEALLEARVGTYRRSHIIVGSDKMTLDQVVEAMKFEIERG